MEFFSGFGHGGCEKEIMEFLKILALMIGVDASRGSSWSSSVTSGKTVVRDVGDRWVFSAGG